MLLSADKLKNRLDQEGKNYSPPASVGVSRALFEFIIAKPSCSVHDL